MSLISVSDTSFEVESDGDEVLEDGEVEDDSSYYSVFADSSDDLEEEVEVGVVIEVVDTIEVEGFDDTPGSAVVVPEVERLVAEVDPGDRRGRLVVGQLLTLEDMGFRPLDSGLTREDRSARVRDLAMFKHTIDMTVSSLQVSFMVLVG